MGIDRHLPFVAQEIIDFIAMLQRLPRNNSNQRALNSLQLSAGPKGGGPEGHVSPEEAMSALKNFFSCTAERKEGGTDSAVTPACK